MSQPSARGPSGKRRAHQYHTSPHSGGGHDGDEGWLVSYADMMTLLVGFFVILNSFSKIDDEKFENAKKEITKEFGGTYQIPYADVSDRLKQALGKMGLGDQFVIKTTDAGVEISFMGTVFFDPGSANLKEKGASLMSELVPIIKAESADFDVTVEGHTDDVPLTSSPLYKNNFELSSIRACRVLNSFENVGFKKERLTAVGYGETRPIRPNRDSNGSAIRENQAENRRVVIKLLKHASPTIGAEATPAPSPAPSPGAEPTAAPTPPTPGTSAPAGE